MDELYSFLAAHRHMIGIGQQHGSTLADVAEQVHRHRYQWMLHCKVHTFPTRVGGRWKPTALAYTSNQNMIWLADRSDHSREIVRCTPVTESREGAMTSFNASRLDSDIVCVGPFVELGSKLYAPTERDDVVEIDNTDTRKPVAQMIPIHDPAHGSESIYRSFFRYDSTHGNFKCKFTRVGDALYCPPFGGRGVLYFRTGDSRATLIQLPAPYDKDAPTGQRNMEAKWRSPFVRAGDGRLYAAPYRANHILVVDPDTTTVSVIALPKNQQNAEYVSPFAEGANGNLFVPPARGDHILMVRVRRGHPPTLRFLPLPTGRVRAIRSSDDTGMSVTQHSFGAAGCAGGTDRALYFVSVTDGYVLVVRDGAKHPVIRSIDLPPDLPGTDDGSSVSPLKLQFSYKQALVRGIDGRMYCLAETAAYSPLVVQVDPDRDEVQTIPIHSDHQRPFIAYTEFTAGTGGQLVAAGNVGIVVVDIDYIPR